MDAAGKTNKGLLLTLGGPEESSLSTTIIIYGSLQQGDQSPPKLQLKLARKKPPPKAPVARPDDPLPRGNSLLEHILKSSESWWTDPCDTAQRTFSLRSYAGQHQNLPSPSTRRQQQAASSKQFHTNLHLPPLRTSCAQSLWSMCRRTLRSHQQGIRSPRLELPQKLNQQRGTETQPTTI